MNRIRRHTKRALIAVAGGLVILIGAVLIPYPGPGWLIVFAGFAILATEFAFAQRALDYLRDKYDAWARWLKRQHISVQILVLAFTGLVIVFTVWILNGPGLVNNVLNLHQDWLVSPLFR
jgi:uncharacterized protein (TIGR02611 family)